MPIRILIVDDHEALREGIRVIIRRARPEWEICGEATNGEDAIEAARRLKPDVVVLDVTMPGMSGLEAAARMSTFPMCRILIFTMHESGELANDARRAGARGYVTKADAARHLITAIETILGGRTFFGQPESAPENPKRGPIPGLSQRIALAFC